MFDIIKVRINQGDQAISDITKAEISQKFRGLPLIQDKKCPANCSVCKDICPADAVSLNPVSIDIGKCIFCGDCQRECPDNIIKTTNFHKISSSSREYLIVDKDKNPASFEKEAIIVRKEITRIFDKSLKLRSVSAGGCNGCEMELNACTNVNFDMGRFGIDIAASPRHSDGIVITGPITENMLEALEDSYLSIPDPKIIIAAGSCAISGGIFSKSKSINRKFLDKYKIDLYIPGCPFHPLTFINGILNFLGRK